MSDTCLSTECPERKSVCCGAISMNVNDEFVCSECKLPYVGGKCTAGSRIMKEKTNHQRDCEEGLKIIKAEYPHLNRAIKRANSNAEMDRKVAEAVKEEKEKWTNAVLSE